MDNKKFEQLIQLITNEDTEQANALFHDIVVEKSREIYESMMDEEEGMDMPVEGRDQVGGLMDELEGEEQGMTEEEDDLGDLDDSGEGEEEVDLDGDLDAGEDEFGGEEGEGSIEDRVVDLEDKLDELMAEFEEIMAGEEGEPEHEGDFGDEADEFGGEEGGEDFGGEEEEMMESATLQPVKGLYGSKIGGDDGANSKSVNLTKPKIVSTGAKPVSAGGSTESAPSAPKAPSNAYTKGETQVKNANSFKNSPGQKTQDLSAAPKPKTGQESGVNDKSIVGEGRKVRR